MKRALLILASVALLTTASVGGVATAATTSDEFTLTAEVAGLFPGADLLLPVSVRNPHPHPLLVHSASIAVGDASPSCSGANVTAASFTGNVTIPAGESGTLQLAVTMSPTAPDACQNATFPLTLSATGELLGVDDPSARPLAFTGLGSATLTLLYLGIVAIASGLLLLTRRRAIGRAIDRSTEGASR